MGGGIFLPFENPPPFLMFMFWSLLRAVHNWEIRFFFDLEKKI